MVLYCLQQSQLANVAANCLQSICTSSREHMASRFAGLLQILQSLDKFSITNEAAVGLLKGNFLSRIVLLFAHIIRMA